MSDSTTDRPDERPLDFIRQIVTADQQAGKWNGQVVTRFPPEPNGYLHIGHAKAILLNFGLAAEFDGICRLRFDDTNPTKEERAYVDAIIDDVAWVIGRDDFDVRYASDYFEEMYRWAEQLIEAGKAYVDEQDAETIRTNRGTVNRPGVDSPFRERSPAENLARFRQMRSGELPDGAGVLRAKIDMAHPNMLMRDPLMYRIQHAAHHRTGDHWCLYPLYDWAHGLEDSIEGVTHSCCSLEFETHRPVYDWFLDQLGIHHPQQIEFNKLNLTHTVIGKRKLMELVQQRLVAGWDDPRLPTLQGLRRRGVPPAAIRSFIDEVGYTKVDTTNEWALFEHHLRRELNASADRTMAVLDPVRLVIENWDADEVFEASVPVNPERPETGSRTVSVHRELWIEADDFMADPPKKFFRLGPDREVRLRGVGFVRCCGFDLDEDGRPTEIRVRLDRDTLGGRNPPDGRKVKATLHWISDAAAIDAEVRLYHHLFAQADPLNVPEGEDWKDHLAEDSLQVVPAAKVPRELAGLPPGSCLQFERLGYFVVDPDSRSELPVFNRTATLRDAWSKQRGR